MLGNTHMMYGLIFAEILFIFFIKGSDEINRYNRVVLWVIGMIGGWSPDMDSLGGFFENLFIPTEPFSYHVFLRYHRVFSHSLGFLVITIIILLVLIIYAKKNYHNEPVNNFHILGNTNLERDWLNLSGLLLVIIGFAIYNDFTKFFAYFFTIGALFFYGLTFIKNDKPFYGIAFFGGALFHHFCDFLACAWNPFGPWNPDIKIGLYLYCSGSAEFINRMIGILVFEVSVHLVGIFIIIRTWMRVRNNNIKK